MTEVVMRSGLGTNCASELWSAAQSLCECCLSSEIKATSLLVAGCSDWQLEKDSPFPFRRLIQTLENHDMLK